MDQVRLPLYAKPILEARAKGRRPTGLVIVSDGQRGLHRLYPDNPVVVTEPGVNPNRYDWRFLADLDVEIATSGSPERTGALVSAVLSGKPFYLRTWNPVTDECVRIWWLGRMWMGPETHPCE